MKHYYNENDENAAAMLFELMKAGEIPKGFIDTRSITEVKPDDLEGYTQCHFFAGIGGWPIALRQAGWPEDKPVWTGSPPCQSWSVAGLRKGKDDKRHLWPVWERLIAERRPAEVFGEQVERAAAEGWLDEVYEMLEAQDYAVGTAVLPASAVGAPHRRERIFFVASNNRSQRIQGQRPQPLQGEPAFSWCQDVRGIEDLRGRPDLPEPLVRSVSDGVHDNASILLALGNAIVPQVAAEFIGAYMEVQACPK